MLHSTGDKRRQLVVNATEGFIGRRLTPGKGEITKVLPITKDTTCEDVNVKPGDPPRLKVNFYTDKKELTNTYDLQFTDQVTLYFSNLPPPSSCTSFLSFGRYISVFFQD